MNGNANAFTTVRLGQRRDRIKGLAHHFVATDGVSGHLVLAPSQRLSGRGSDLSSARRPSFAFWAGRRWQGMTSPCLS
jgi:hypothetical protein